MQAGRRALREPNRELLYECAMIMLTSPNPHPPSYAWAVEFVVAYLQRECKPCVKAKLLDSLRTLA